MDKVQSSEQQQLANQVGGPRRFCNDVLLDALHFLQRNEHAQVRLASRRLLWLSNVACARLPQRVVPRLEVRGVHAPPPTDNGVLRAEAAGPQQQMVANSMRVCPASGSSYLVDFPEGEPPEHIVHLSELEIYDFVGPELLQFLRVSARLLGECTMVFFDFENFVRHHSIDFFIRFLALFPSANRTIELFRLSSLSAPLFRDHPAMFDCAELGVVNCLDTFPFDALLGWLHLVDQHPLEQRKKRFLAIRFDDEVQMLGQSIDTSVRHFIQLVRQHFLSATSCCFFRVEIHMFGVLHPPELDPFVEDNERTGERLEAQWMQHLLHQFFAIRRGRRESTAAEETEEQATTKQMDRRETLVFIEEVVQGDKQQQVPDSEV